MLLCSIEEAWGNDFLNIPNKNKNNIQNSNKNKIKSNISKNNQKNNQINNQKNSQQNNNKLNIHKSKLDKSIKVLKGGNKKKNVYNDIIIFTIVGYIMLFISHICFELGFEINN